MVMKLEKVVPFGRSLDEYKNMFAFSNSDLNKKIIGVGDGPASFNAEMFALGKSVVSVDPLYAFRAEEIEQQFESVVDNIISQVKATPNDWIWSYHRSPEHLKENRVNVLHRFVADYEIGRAEGRYIVGELPIWSLKTKSSTLRSVHISCFCTPIVVHMSFIWRRFSKCCAWRPRFAFFRC